MTLPDPSNVYRQLEDCQTRRGQLESATLASSSNNPDELARPSSADNKRKMSQHLKLMSRKSTGDQLESSPQINQKAKRKGSIAQVSMSGVKRLSHKLSIKKRHSNKPQPAMMGRRSSGLSSGSANSQTPQLVAAAQGRHRKTLMSKQQSSLSSADKQSNPIQVGKQILDAYLAVQRRRQLEAQLEAEKAAAEEGAEKSSEPQRSSAANSELAARDAQQQQPSRSAFVRGSGNSTRKSFKDFKHISRRIFAWQSSSKMLKQMSLATSQPSDKEKLEKLDRLERRKLARVERSETVYEVAPTTCPPLATNSTQNVLANE